jgi:hypothetical protein
MTLEMLQSAWESELAKGAGSSLAGSPAFREAQLMWEAARLREQTARGAFKGWHKDGPSFPKQRLVGTRALGRAYEKQVGKLLWEQSSSLGWSFRDHEWLQARDGWLQPDFLLQSPAGALLFEVKLTYTPAGWKQLERYQRAIWEVVRLETIPVLVCKHLAPGAPSPVEFFEDVFPGALWHVIV